MKKIILLMMLFVVFVVFAPIVFAPIVFAEPNLVCDPMAADAYDVEIRDVVSGQLVANPKGVPPDPTGTYGFALKLIPLNLPDGNYIAKALAQTMWGPTGWSNEHPFEKNVGAAPANVHTVDIP